MGVGALLSSPCCSGDALVKEEEEIGKLHWCDGNPVALGLVGAVFFPIKCNNCNCNPAQQNTNSLNQPRKIPSGNVTQK